MLAQAPSRSVLAEERPPSAEGVRAGPSDAELEGTLERGVVVRAAMLRSVAVRAGRERALAIQSAARAEGSLPAPELMAEVWQVPLARPARLNAQMVVLGVSQHFPAPGALGARADAIAVGAQAAQAMADDQARLIGRDAGHAYADYVESASRHRIHRAHHEIAARLLALVRARHAAGGSLVDETKADVELARVEADLVTDAALVESARARINVLLGRDVRAPLGLPASSLARVPAAPTQSLIATARRVRPEVRAAEAARAARALTLRAAEREATWPSFSVGALYFPPTDMNPQHGYGASASLSLPWLYGGSRDRMRAEQQYLRADASNVEAQRIPIDSEVVAAATSAASAAARLRVLRERALPATQRAFDVARAGYESGRADLLTVLDARRSLVDLDEALVMSQSSLDHALVSLDAAVGLEVPTTALSAEDPPTIPRPGVDHEP